MMTPRKNKISPSRWILIPHRVAVLALWAALVVFLFSGFAWAAPVGEPVTEELGFIEIGDVFAAAKHLQSLREAPASITIVNDEEIKHYGYRSLTDAVNGVPGFYTYSDRNYEYIGARGFARLGDYGNRVLQLIDGHINNDNIYGSFFLGHDFGVDMDLVRKIEFIRGPGSALFGSNALLGTVNVITKSGADLGGLAMAVEGGSGGGRSGKLAYGHRYGNGLDLLVSAAFLNSLGEDLHYREFADSSPSRGWAFDADGERARKFLLKAAWGELSLLANLGWREKNVPTASFGTLFNDNRSRTIDQRAFAEIAWDHPLDADARLKSRFYYDSYRFEGYYAYDYPPVTINRDEVSGRWVGSEVTYSRKISSHYLLLGGEIADHLEARQKNYDEDPLVVYLDEDHSFTNGSLFGQDEWDITPWLRFSGGVRYDRYSTFGDHISPKAGFILRPAGGSTIKLLYGQAFRAPNVYEFYYKTNTGTSVYRDNPALKPETIHTYELVLEQELTPVSKLTASGFHYEIKDLISQEVNPDLSLQFYNVSRVRSDGVELGLEVNWPGFLKGHVGYTYQDTRDDLTGRWLANSPRHLLKTGLRLPLYREILFAGAQCRYMGQRQDRDGNDVGGALVTDINLTADYRGLTLSAGAYNLFDVVYVDPVSADHIQKTVQLAGRNFWFKVGYTF